MKKEKILCTPGFKLHADRLARRLRSDGTYSESPGAHERGYLSVTMVRESAKRVCELVMKTRRFARERNSMFSAQDGEKW